jgi:PAS domain S-box-containing protein
MEQGQSAGRSPGGNTPNSVAPGTLYDLVPSATWVLDADGLVTMWSRSAEQLFGYTRDQVLGRWAGDLMDPPLRPEDKDAIEREIADAELVGGIYRMRRADGTVGAFESRSAFVTDAQGNRSILITSVEADALHRVEADLAMRQALFDQSPIGVGIFDTDLKYVAVNDALAAMDGVPAGEHVGRTIDEIMPGIDTARVRTIQQRVLDTGEPVVDSRIFGPIPVDGGPRTVWSMSYNRLQAQGGKTLGISC